MNRPSSLPSDYFARPQKADVSATVLSVSDSGAVDVQLGSGEILRRVDLAGAASAGDAVMLRYDEHGKYTVLGSRPSGATTGAAYVIASGSSGGGGSGTIPDPHDLLGAHHTLPTVSAGQVLAGPTSTNGTPSFRALGTGDLPTMLVTAGNGLTSTGTLPSGIAINVNAGDGISVDTSSVAVRLASPSGLSFTSAALQVADSIAGAGLTMANKQLKLADGVAGAGLVINSTTKAINVSAGSGISVAASPSAVEVNQGYAFTWTAAHTFNARPAFAAGATVSAGQTLRFGADVDLQRGAANVLTLGAGDAMRSSSYQSGVSGWGVSDAGDAEFNNVRVRGEFSAAVFRTSEISATAGTFGVYLSASVVHDDFTTPASVGSSVAGVQIKNGTPSSAIALFTAGDRLQVKAWNGTALVNAWFSVNASPAPAASTGYTTYSLKLESGSTSAVVGAGTAIVDHGTASGGGALTLSADGAVGTAPNLSVTTNAGSPWSTTTLRARLGNLNGGYGYTTDVYGFAAGDSSATFVSVDSTNGFRVVRSSTPRFVVDNSGNLSINNSAGTAVVSMDTSGNASIAGVLSVGTSGEIRQGSGTIGANFQGLRIWNSGTYGQIAGYNSSNATPQWFADTDGKLKTAGGQTVIDATGILLNANQSEFPSGMGFLGEYRFGQWAAATGWGNTDLAGLKHRYGFRLATTTIYNNDLSAYNRIEIDASAGSTGTISLKGTDIETWGTLWLTPGTGLQDTNLYRLAANSLKTDDSFTVALGLNVGTATGAGTGEIATSGNVTIGKAANPTLTLSSANSGGGSRAFLKWESQNAGDYFLAGYYADASPRRMQWYYNSDGSASAVPVLSMTAANRVGVNVAAPGYTLDVAGDIRATSGIIGTTPSEFSGALNNVPSTSGSTSEAALRVRGLTGSGTGLDISASGAAGFQAGWIQARNTSNYATNYQLFLNPNGGNIAINKTSASYPLDVAGDVNSTGVYRVSGTQVVRARVTGWAAAIGTATRTAYTTSTVTTAQLAERVKALIDDLTTHGLIGA